MRSCSGDRGAARADLMNYLIDEMNTARRTRRPAHADACYMACYRVLRTKEAQ